MFCAVINIGTPGKSLGCAAVGPAGSMVDGTDVGICISVLSGEAECQNTFENRASGR